MLMLEYKGSNVFPVIFVKLKTYNQTNQKKTETSNEVDGNPSKSEQTIFRVRKRAILIGFSFSSDRFGGGREIKILRPITQARSITKKGVETSIRLPTFGKCTRWTSVYPLPPSPRHSTTQFPWYLARTHLPTYIGGERRWTNPVPRSYRVAVTETA